MSSDTAIATVDASPYFERVLRHAVKEGYVDALRLDAIRREGAKGIVQLAAYFGTDFRSMVPVHFGEPQWQAHLAFSSLLSLRLITMP